MARLIRSGELRTPRNADGFTYLTALFVVAIVGAGLALLSELWHTASLREKEAELLYVGNQYRRAIELYYRAGPQRYPRSLEELLKDPRTPNTQRYLRRIYADPMTGNTEWSLVKGPDGGIMGVHSSSERKPLKTANFKVRDREFERASKYSDWKFVFAAAPQTPKPPAGVPSVTPAAP